jgi:hypothetical protein
LLIFLFQRRIKITEKLWIRLAVLTIAITADTSTAGLPDANGNTVPSAGMSEKKYDLHNPASWLELGGDFRFRVDYDNARKLDKEAVGHDRINTRYRPRVQAKIKFSEDVDFNIRLMAEARYYHRPSSMDKQLIDHEAIFDRFNLTLRKVFDLPMTAVIGRQDITLGSGWLITDGTPRDGGRTAFFDAMRFTYNLEKYDATADIIWIQDHADSAKWLKPFNDRDFDLVEQDEQGAILYLTQKTSKDAGRDLYLIYKHDNKRIASSGYEGEIYTIGTRLYGRFNERWQYSFEFAPQFGHKNGKSLNAFGTNNQFIYNLNDEKKNKIYLGYEYLSGNDDKDKNFDRLFGRVDTWSVLYQGCIDSIDGRAYDNSNLHRVYADWETNLTEKTNLRCGYNLLFADDNTSAGGTGGLSKSGNFRGQLLRSVLKYKVSKNITHFLEGELFFPGDFYNNSRNDVAVFARYGILFTW